MDYLSGHAPLDKFMLRLRTVLSSPGLAKASLMHIEYTYNYLSVFSVLYCGMQGESTASFLTLSFRHNY